MTDKFTDEIVAEQQRIAGRIVSLKDEIEKTRSAVESKEIEIQTLAGKLDVLKQVHQFYTQGTVTPPEQQSEQPQAQQPQYEQQQPEPQSVFPDKQEGLP